MNEAEQDRDSTGDTVNPPVPEPGTGLVGKPDRFIYGIVAAVIVILTILQLIILF